MKTKIYYLALAVSVGILCVLALGEVKPPHGSKPGLIGKINPMLSGRKKLYVIVEPADVRSSIGGLVWADLQRKIEEKVKRANIEIAEGVHLGQGFRAQNIPELRVQMEMIRFADLKLYVFRARTTLAAKAHLEERDLYFKADIWKSTPVLQSVPEQEMSVVVTNTILAQVEAFLGAWRAANPQDGQSSGKAGGASGTIVQRPQRPTKPITKRTVAKQQYAGSKNSKIFHKPDCSWVGKIKAENLRSYASREEAVGAGKRACKTCKP